MDADGAVMTLDQGAVAEMAALLVGGVLPRDASGLAGLLTALEGLKATASGVQARASVALSEALVAEQREAGTPASRLGRGVAAAVALARRESPHAGDRWLGVAKALVHEMPHTLGLLEAGVLSEYRASLVVRETACLTLEDRRRVDEEVCGDAERVATWGNRQLAAEARRSAYRLAPYAVLERHQKAVGDRSVSLRPAEDGMTWLTALLPLAEGVACLKALREAATSARAAGDERGSGQVMADTLVKRLTGQATADAVGVGVFLVMTPETLLDAGDEPAVVPGFGPLAAPLARQLVARAVDDETASWLRRVYRDPASGDLVSLDSRARRFPAGLASLIEIRDQRCRTPWCDAPIRHSDHVVPSEEGGRTSLANGQGLCEACNYTKQAIGWEAQPRPGPRAPVRLTSPAGQSVTSWAPDPPRAPESFTEVRSRVEGERGVLSSPIVVDLWWARAS